MEDESSDESSPAQNPDTGMSGCGSLGCSTLFVLGFFGIPLYMMWGGAWEGGEAMVVPIFIGGPSFLIGNIFATMAVNSESKPEQTIGYVAFFLLWGPISLGCILGLILSAVSQLS